MTGPLRTEANASIGLHLADQQKLRGRKWLEARRIVMVSTLAPAPTVRASRLTSPVALVYSEERRQEYSHHDFSIVASSSASAARTGRRGRVDHERGASCGTSARQFCAAVEQNCRGHGGRLRRIPE